MVSEIINKLRSNPFAIKLKGKGFLYNIELLGKMQSNQNAISFDLSGSLRVGPLKSPGTVTSNYEMKEDQFLLKDHSIDYPNLKFHENYKRDEDTMLFSKKEKGEKEVVGESFLEPLPFLFYLLNLNREENLNYAGHLLVGGKNKDFHFAKDRAEFKVRLNNKPLFQGSIGEGAVALYVPQFKVKLELTRF